jgi:hypothetical protein
MTVEERAKALIEKWEAGTYYGGAVQKRAALQVAIIDALKEQDRDTRHACSEAVNCLPSSYEAPTGTDLVDKDDVRAACVNVKAV